MQRILVTGANKGVGLALVEAILSSEADTFVYLCSRDLERGRRAAASLVETYPGRIEVVELDVADDRSVADAKQQVTSSLASERLYGVVNNAGIGMKIPEAARIVDTNTFGVRRVCEAFLPLLDPKLGRVVNVTSAAGPMFVASESPETQRLLLDPAITWPRLETFIEERLAKGFNDGAAYGFSKACANSYTMILAREHAGLKVNACTPGYIDTDLTRPPGSEGKSTAELGMKTPREGTVAPMYLLFGELDGNGYYYGSDAKRSPLDRYRAPGAPAFTGD
jgi:carbonyl reductase 1